MLSRSPRGRYRGRSGCHDIEGQLEQLRECFGHAETSLVLAGVSVLLACSLAILLYLPLPPNWDDEIGNIPWLLLFAALLGLHGALPLAFLGHSPPIELDTGVCWQQHRCMASTSCRLAN